jgi:hypothetical protein
LHRSIYLFAELAEVLGDVGVDGLVRVRCGLPYHGLGEKAPHFRDDGREHLGG